MRTVRTKPKDQRGIARQKGSRNVARAPFGSMPYPLHFGLPMVSCRFAAAALYEVEGTIW